jgi:hypothetical protein
VLCGTHALLAYAAMALIASTKLQPGPAVCSPVLWSANMGALEDYAVCMAHMNCWSLLECVVHCHDMRCALSGDAAVVFHPSNVRDLCCVSQFRGGASATLGS